LSNEDEVYNGELTDIEIACPQCFTLKFVKVPNKLIQESEHLITISIPMNYMCDHCFQVFIDKQYQIRGYQSTDFDVSEIEIYETGSKTFDGIITYAVSLIIKKTINILTKSKEVGDILGGALFNQQGNVLYFSLPDEIFLNMINQFELQKQDQEIKLHKMIFALENREKVFAEYLNVEDYILIIVVLFPSYVSINEGNIYLNKLYEDIMHMEDPTEIMKKEQQRMKQIESAKKKQIPKKESIPSKEQVIIEKPEPSNFWIYAKFSNVSALEKADKVFLGTLGVDIDKKKILNLEEIIRNSKDKPFEGKIYFSERYVRLMEGLALTIKDAAIFLSQLNKMP
jgi:hypothetical protein